MDTAARPCSVHLLDASIYIFQAHFSPHLRVWSRDSREQSAFAGFSRFLLRLLQGSRPVAMAVAFDESLFCGFRHALYAGYKANRVLPDENLAGQLRACAALCGTLGLAAYASRRYEADDIIGTLAATVRRADPGHAVTIISRDKDLAQLLLGPSDVLWDVQRNRRRDRNAIVDEYGMEPEQFPCYLGLTGDSVDCIPGVPGVGPAAARALLQHFRSMDQLYARLDEVPALAFRGAARCRERLALHREQAELSRELARIIDRPGADCSEPFSVTSADTLRRRHPDREAFCGLLETERVDEREGRLLLALFDGLPVP